MLLCKYLQKKLLITCVLVNRLKIDEKTIEAWFGVLKGYPKKESISTTNYSVI